MEDIKELYRDGWQEDTREFFHFHFLSFYALSPTHNVHYANAHHYSHGYLLQSLFKRALNSCRQWQSQRNLSCPFYRNELKRKPGNHFVIPSRSIRLIWQSLPEKIGHPNQLALTSCALCVSGWTQFCVNCLICQTDIYILHRDLFVSSLAGVGSWIFL